MINMDTAIDYMYGLKAKNIRYSMDYSRTGADGTGDCSGTVYAALRKAGASDAGSVVNTDSMHDWLVKNGFRLIAHNKEWNAKRGDIVIFGEKGKSGGVAGHVVIFISNTQIIHCTWKSDSVNGVFVENEATDCPYSMGWYVYRLDQKTHPLSLKQALKFQNQLQTFSGFRKNGTLLRIFLSIYVQLQLSNQIKSRY